MEFKEIKVESDETKNVYDILKLQGLSENYILKLRKNLGNVLVNGSPSSVKTLVNQGDVISVNSNPYTSSSIQFCIIPLDIVFEDEDVLIINKPSNLVTMPTKMHYEYNLAGAIMHYFEGKDFVVRIFNRLDKDTSGLVLVAKNSFICSKISNIQKTYCGICEGKLEKDMIIAREVVTQKLSDGKNAQKRVVSEHSETTFTEISPIKFTASHTLFEARIKGGKTHQIRVHLSSVGLPLLGDEIYGKSSDLISHTALICKNMSFYHPTLQKVLSFEVDYPKDFQKTINYLGLS